MQGSWQVFAFVLARSFVLIPLGGCVHDIQTTVDTPGMPNPEIAMRESIAHVDSEMSELGRLGPARNAVSPVVPGELNKVVTFEWDGPLDGAVEKLARTIGYTVSIDAPWDAPPVPVRIAAGPQRIYELFEAIGGAAGDQATVQVDPQNHRVAVIHHV